MTVDSAEGTPFAGLREAGAREDDVLCLLLLYHRHILEERSPLKKHVDALPREYHQTIFYSGKIFFFFFFQVVNGGWACSLSFNSLFILFIVVMVPLILWSPY